MAKKKVKEVEAVEVESTEVEEVEETVAVRTMIQVGMTENGDVFFRPDGSDQSLIALEGLLKYAERHMDKLWERSFNQE